MVVHKDRANASVGRKGKGEKIIPILLLLIVNTLIPILLLEGVLRVFPGIISEPVLVEFPKALRHQVADRLGLPLKQARRCISSADRYDKGPELCLAYPNFLWIHRLDAVARQYGAQAEIHQDSNGFCNPEQKGTRDQNDILFVGDSFTWCWTVGSDKAFSSLLENRLGETTYNLGFPGIGPYEYVEILKRFGLEYSPRLVVMNIYEGNDLRDSARYWRSVEAWGGKGAVEDGTTNDKRKNPLLSKLVLNNSYSLSFIGASIETVRKRFFRHSIDFRYLVNVNGEEIPMNVANADRDEVKNARRLREGKVRLAMWRDALVEFVRLADKHGFRPVVTYIPSAHTAYAANVVFEDRMVGLDLAYLSSTQRAYLNQLAGELGFTFLDLTESLQHAVVSGPLAYFPGSVHLTKHGHALIADALAPFLKTVMDSAAPDGGWE